MTPLRTLSLFAGVGGFDLGLERTGGFRTVAFCEIDPFCQRVLAKHWPGVPIYDDVKTLTGERLAADGIAADVICGGFPCQDVSATGRRGGVGEGTRSGLYTELLRLARDLRPQFILMENVAGLLSGPTQQGLAEGPLFRQRYLLQQPSRGFTGWPGRSGLPKSRICGRNDGVPDVPHRVGALGNAVVPQIPELIGRAILASLEEQRKAA
jgi:DNA (cytosine-5)-methyltransferase 1